MPLIPWKPFDDIDRFFDDDNWFAPVVSRLQNIGPAMDVYETEKEVVAEVNLPGVSPERVEVTVRDQMLRVRGTSEEKAEEKKKGYWRKEIRKGSFERAVRLPAPVDEEKVDATYEKGVLKIVMMKSSGKKDGRKIQIKTKG